MDLPGFENISFIRQHRTTLYAYLPLFHDLSSNLMANSSKEFTFLMLYLFSLHS